MNKQLIILFVPLTFLLVFFRKEIISVVFMRGAFDSIALEITSSAFLFYSAGLIIAAIEPLFIRTCYAFSMTMVPLLSTITSVVFIIPLNYYLIPILGVAGIALATNLGFLLRVVIQAVYLRKKLGGLAIAEIFRSFAFSTLCATVAILAISKIPSDNLAKLLTTIVIFFLVFLGLGLLVMNKEMRTMWRLVRQNFGTGSSE